MSYKINDEESRYIRFGAKYGLPWAKQYLRAYTFKAGNNTLALSKEACLILGVVDDDAYIPVYHAGLINRENIKDLRWLFN